MKQKNNSWKEKEVHIDELPEPPKYEDVKYVSFNYKDILFLIYLQSYILFLFGNNIIAKIKEVLIKGKLVLKIVLKTCKKKILNSLIKLKLIILSILKRSIKFILLILKISKELTDKAIDFSIKTQNKINLIVKKSLVLFDTKKAELNKIMFYVVFFFMVFALLTGLKESYGVGGPWGDGVACAYDAWCTNYCDDEASGYPEGQHGLNTDNLVCYSGASCGGGASNCDNIDGSCNYNVGASSQCDDYSENSCVGSTGYCDTNCQYRTDGDYSSTACTCLGDTYFTNLGTVSGSNSLCCGDDTTSDDFSTYSDSLTTSTSLSCRNCLNGAAGSATTLYGNGYKTGTTCYYGDISCGSGASSSGSTCTLTISTDACIDSVGCLNQPSSLTTKINSSMAINSELGSLRLDWTDNSGVETGFSIYRSADNTTFSEVGTTSTNVVTFSDDSIDDNTIYYYKVGAYYSTYDSTNSSVVHNITADRTSPESVRFGLVERDVILYYDFDENSSSVVADKSAWGNDGVSTGDPTWTSNTGYDQGGLKLDGDGDYVYKTYAGTSALNLAEKNFSISMWLKTNLTNNPQALTGIYNVDGDIRSYLVYISGGNRINFCLSSLGTWDSVTCATSDTYDFNGWTLVTATYNQSTMNLYVNNTFSNSTTYNGGVYSPPKSAVFRVGRIWYVAGDHYQFNGSVDDVRVYQKPLSLTEISELYNNSAENYVDLSWTDQDVNDGLVLYMPFEEGTGTITKDWSDKKNDGLLMNSPTWNSSSKYGKGIDLDGTDDFVNVSHSSSLGIGQDEFTWTAWIYPKEHPTEGIIFNKENAYEWAIDSSGNIKWAINNTVPGWTWRTTEILAEINEWSFVALTYDGSNVDAYDEGILVNSTTASGIIEPNDVHLRIGARNLAAPSSLFNGSIDEVRIYNSSLSQREIIDVMQSGLIKKGIYRSNVSGGTYKPVDGYYDDFEDGDATGWVCASGSCDIASSPASGSYSYKIYYDGADGMATLNFDDTMESGLVQVKMRAVETADEQRIQINSATGREFILSMYTNGRWYAYNGGWIDSGISYELDRWYDVKLYFDGISKTSKVYVDDQLILDDVSYESGGSSINLFRFYCRFDGCVMYGDDLSITKLITDTNYTDTDGDITDPNEVSSLTSTSHSSSTWSTDNTVDLTWATATDVGTPYYYYIKAFDDSGNDNNILNGSIEKGPIGSTVPGWGANMKLNDTRSYSGLRSGLIDKQTAGELTSIGPYMPIPDSSIQYLYGGCFYSDGPEVQIYLFSWDSSPYDGTYDAIGSSTTGEWTCIQKLSTNVIPSDKFITLRMDNEGSGKVWFDNLFIYPVKNTTVLSGLDGYDYSCDTSSGEFSGSTKDYEETQTTHTCTFDDGASNYFHIVSKDNTDNWDATSADIGPFYIDTVAPSDCTLDVLNDSSQYSHVSGSTIFYNTEVAGSFTVNVSADDATSGIDDVGFPVTVSGGVSDTDVNYEHTYSWDTSDTFDDSVVITCTDNAGLTDTTGFTLTRDIFDPSGGSISYDNGFSDNEDITFTDGSDDASGLNTSNSRIYISSADMYDNNTCGTYNSWAQEGGLGEPSPYTDSLTAGKCYKYKYEVYDNVQNNVNYTSSDVLKYNNIPTQNQPVVIPLSPILTSNLTCNWTTLSEADGQDVVNITNWYRNNESITILNMPFEGNNGDELVNAKDYSGYQNNGSVNGAQFNRTGGKIGGAYEFDGSSYISISDSPSKLSTTSLTVMAWVYQESLTAESGIVGKYTWSSQTSWAFQSQNGDGDRLYLYIADEPGDTSAAWVQSNDGVRTTGWQHVAFVFDGSGATDIDRAKIYVDGEDETWTTSGTIPTELQASTAPIKIGDSLLNRYWTGKIDEVKIFNMSLTRDQIYQEYLAGYNNRTSQVIIFNETNYGEEWHCSVIRNDGYQESSAQNSTSETILGLTPTINSHDYFPNKVYYDTNSDALTVYVSANVTDDNLVSVNFTIRDPSGTNVIENINASAYNGDIFNSTTFSLNKFGVWNYTITAYDGHDTSATEYGNITFLEITSSLNASTVAPEDIIRITGHINDSLGNDVATHEISIYIDDSLITPTGWWNSSWKYRKNISIDNLVSTTVNDSIVLVNFSTTSLISEGKLNSDCSDIRFTNNNEAELEYTMYDDSCNSANTLFWVWGNFTKETNTTIWVYYNNPSISSKVNDYTNPDSSLILYMHLDNSSDYGETDTKVFDFSKNGNNGTASGVDFSSTAMFGKSALVSTADTISSGDIDDIDGLSEMTISLWLNPVSLTTQDMIISKGDFVDQNSFALRTQNAASDEIYFFIADGLSDTGSNYISTSDLNLANDVWYHLVVVYDGSLTASNRLKVYKNGDSVSGSITGTIATSMTSGSTSNLKIGKGDYSSYDSFNGYIDDVRIYKKAFTSDQILAVYNSTKPYFIENETITQTDSSGYYNYSFTVPITEASYVVKVNTTYGLEYGEQTADFTVEIPNTAPTHDSPFITPTYPNETSNLTCNWNNVQDLDNDAVINITNWYLNNKSITSLYLPFEGGSTSGNGAETGNTKDYSGYDNNGTVYNATWSSSLGKIGGAYNFTSVNHTYIETDLVPTENQSFTMIAWFWSDDVTASSPARVIMGDKDDQADGSTDGCSLKVMDDYLYVWCSNSTRQNYYQRITTTAEEWHFAALVFDNETENITLYHDSSRISGHMKGFKPEGVSGRLEIGRQFWGNYGWFNGLIDEVRFFDIALSPEQINEIYTDESQSKYSNILLSYETSPAEEWMCSVTPNDGYVDGITKNSTGVNITLSNIKPGIPTLISPSNGNITLVNNPPIFIWENVTNEDNDHLEFSINISSPECADYGTITGITALNYTPTIELTLDCNYSWEVRAYDGIEYGEWSDNFTFKILPTIILTMVNDSIDFGVLSINESKDTDTLGGPFVIRNDGNVMANITWVSINQSLFTSVGANTEYLRFKVDNTTEEPRSFNYSNSTTEWTNLDLITETNKTAIGYLNYSDGSDEAEIDINITVPIDEPPGLKSILMYIIGQEA